MLIRGFLAVGVAAMVLTGCTAQPIPAPTPSATPISAEETCGEMADVVTLIDNAGFAKSAGHFTQFEYDGVLRIAARMLFRVQVAEGTDLAAGIDQLKASTPKVPTGPSTLIFDPYSPGWNKGRDAVSAACEAAGSIIGIPVWDSTMG